MKPREFIWTEHELLAEYLFPRDGPRWLMRRLGNELSGTNADLCSIDDDRLQLSIPESWKNEGLFGKVKDDDSPLFDRVGLGRKVGGSTILYSRSALKRLHYVVVGAQAGLGVKKIKSALEFDIPIHDLGLCADLQSWRYALTKPLVLLLNNELDLEKDGGEKAYDRIWHCTESFDREMKRIQRAFPTGSALELDNRFERSHGARDAFPLTLLLTPPGSQHRPALNLYFAGISEAEKTVGAMRRIVGDPPGRQSDWQLVKAHAIDEYDVQIETSGDESVVYKGDVFEPTPTRPMPLLEQAASHLVMIRDEIRAWIGVCKRYRPEGGHCDRTFALAHPGQQTCKTQNCQNQNSASPSDAQP